MNILLTGLLKIGYVDSVKYALEKLGHTVYFVDSASFYHTAGYWHRKADKVLCNKLSARYKRAWNNHIIEVCRENKIDIFFSVSADQVTKVTVDTIRAMKIKTMVWLLDGAVRGPEFVATAVWYDKAYTFDEQDARMLKDKWQIAVEYCPVGYDERYFFVNGNEERNIDICFVGMADENRKALLEEVAKAADKYGWNMYIQGIFYPGAHFWKKLQFEKKYPYIYKYLHNSWLDFANVGDLYRHSKLVLNISTPGQKSINPRAFEIMACGALHIMNSGQDVKRYISNEQEFVEYDSMEDLREKILMLLSDSSKRITISRCGTTIVSDKFSMRGIIERIITIK